MGGDDLLAVGQQLEQLSRVVYAAQVRFAGEVDAQGLAASCGATSAADLLRQALLINPHDARTRINTARQVLPQDLPSGGQAPAVLPVVAAALG